jgi:hypothetical protein
MIRCREIATADLGAVADFRTRGFAGRSRSYWMDGLQRQSERQPRRARLADRSDTELAIYRP